MKQIPRIGAGLASLCFLTVSAVHAQQIVVDVNGQDTGTQSAEIIHGVTMVPLRVVSESLGGQVQWNPDNQTVTITKGQTTISMSIGKQDATVNGQTVTMEVPPDEFNGRTLVPLRFIAEAFGATVNYDPATRIVDIKGAGEQTETIRTESHLDRAMPPLDFSDDASGWVTSGKAIHFVLNAEPGAQAAVVMPGLSQEIPMQETSAGHYEANWTPPSDSTLTVNSETAMAKLTYNGNTYYSTQRNFNLDNQPPAILSMAPADGTTIGGYKPTISVNYLDNGSGIDPSKVTISVNGQDVTPSAQINTQSLSYTFPTNLTPGIYHVRVNACDKAGNTVTKEWTFTATGAQDTSDFTISEGNGTLREGKEVDFSLKAAPGSQVSVNVQNGPSIPLAETSPGVFTGSYTVRHRDFFGGNLVTAVVTPPNAAPYTLQCAQRMGVSGDLSPRSMAPVIASPLASDEVNDDVVVAGSAPPASTVTINVSYKSKLNDHTSITGSIADITVVADTAGNFQSTPIHIPHSVRGSRVRITATTVLPDGTESPATVLILNTR